MTALVAAWLWQLVLAALAVGCLSLLARVLRLVALLRSAVVAARLVPVVVSQSLLRTVRRVPVALFRCAPVTPPVATLDLCRSRLALRLPAMLAACRLPQVRVSVAVL
jgi:hypothetical protein